MKHLCLDEVGNRRGDKVSPVYRMGLYEQEYLQVCLFQLPRFSAFMIRSK
jgi:hypothetical protein